MTSPPTFPGEEERLQVLDAYDLIDTLPEEALDDLAQLASQIFEVPIALISLVDGHRQWFKARFGLDEVAFPREISFCAHALGSPELFVIPDAAVDERFAGNPLVTGPTGIRFYAGAPLVSPEGAILGALCVMDREPRLLSAPQEETLLVLSRLAMSQLELRRQGLELRRQTQALAISEGKLRAIFENGPDSVKLLSSDATLLEVNPAGLELMEAENLEGVAGQSLLPLVAPEDRPLVRNMLTAVAAGERRTVHFRIIGLKGKLRWVEMSGAPFQDHQSGQNFVLGVSRDITDRKLAEQKIERLNRLYAVSSRISELIVRIKNPTELYDQACRIAVDQGGLSLAWVGLARPDSELLRPVAHCGKDEGYLDDLRISIQGPGPAGRAFREGEGVHCNDIATDPISAGYWDGALRQGFQSCAAFPLRVGGASIGVFMVYCNQTDCFDTEEMQLLGGLAENISFALESHQQEERRLLAEERYRTLFEYAPDGIVIADGESIYLDVNDSACRMLGYAREELIGLSATDIVVPAEIPFIDTALSEIKGQAEYYREWKFRRKDGTEFAAEVIATMMPDGNILGVIRDISERKRTEGRLRRLIESNAQGVMFWKTNGTITDANDAFLDLIGYSRADLEEGLMDWRDLTPPEFHHLDRKALQEMTATGVCTPFEKEYLRKDGTRIPVLLGAALFEDNPEEGSCFVLDLTERKRLEQQFLRAQRMESIGTLAGGIAHDLNNVLAPIMMSIDLLQMKFSDAASQHLLALISTSSHRGADMVQQLLSFARGVEGRRLEVQIRHLIREIEKIVNDTFLKHIEVRTRVPDKLSTVLGDPTQLHQVLLNLCLNARDAMPHGGILTITAKNILLDAHYAGLHPEAKEGPYVFIQVDDTGTGMPPDVMEKIFDPFYTTKEIGKGTGLGLSTSIAIVKSHGGFIRVYSEAGAGSKFEVYLPARTEASSAAAEALVELPRGNGELILVVDDEASVREVTRQTLEAFGYRVIVAGDGSEALAIYASQSEEIAVVLTDMMMPVMDGPSTIRVLRKMNPGVRIIGASGLASNGHVTRSAGMGVKHFLSKPYAAPALLKAIKETLFPKP